MSTLEQSSAKLVDALTKAIEGSGAQNMPKVIQDIEAEMGAYYSASFTAHLAVFVGLIGILIFCILLVSLCSRDVDMEEFSPKGLGVVLGIGVGVIALVGIMGSFGSAVSSWIDAQAPLAEILLRVLR